MASKRWDELPKEIKTFPREMLVWDDEDYDDNPPEVRTVIQDMGEEYAYRYLVDDGVSIFDTNKKLVTFFKHVKEIEVESTKSDEFSDEFARYFFLTFSVERTKVTDTTSYTTSLNRFPTHKECVEFGEEEASKGGKFESVFLLSMTELSKEDYDTFKSETK